MRNAYRESLVWAVALATLMLPLPSAAVPLASSQAYEQAQFVFAGTVVRAGSKQLSLGVEGPAIVVRVDKVYKGTPVFADLVHRQVTVMTPAGTAAPKRGMLAIFSTAAYAFAENAVVREIAMEPGTATDATAHRVAALDAAAATSRLRANLAASDVVVVGTVVGDIRRVAVKRTFGEHDPQLRVADVAVKSVERGKPVVRSPCCSPRAVTSAGCVRRSCGPVSRPCSPCNAIVKSAQRPEFPTTSRRARTPHTSSTTCGR